MKKILKIIIVVVVLFILWRLLYGLFLSDETKITKIIEKTAERTEKRNAFQFMSFFDKSFSDDSGLRYDELRAIGFRIFQMYKEIDVEHMIKSITVDGDKAEAEMDLSVTVTERGILVDLIHGARKTNGFIITMEKIDGDWMFVKSEKP